MFRIIACVECKSLLQVGDLEALAGWIECKYCGEREKVVSAIRRSDAE